MDQPRSEPSVAPPPTTDYRPVRNVPGADTVINLERRGVVGVPSAPVPNQTASGVWLRLFPTDSQMQNSGSAPVEAGLNLGHFQIEERIGAGGMGAVFRANDVRLDRAVALKILTPVLSRDEAAVLRFRNEARAAARLDHENIARVYFIGEEQGLNFIAFEFITGQNLRAMINQHGRIEPTEAVNYVLQIASALRHTSANGVVHRDIKPSNIIITPSGRAKLVDLGLARKENSESGPDLTLAGTTLGTFDYISPEQAKDPRNVDVRSDIYSLGCTLYHMLTGEPPYPEGTVLKKLLDHQSGEPPDPAKKNRHVSDELSVIVRKMMASDPKKRYQTPDQLIRDLMLIAGSLGLRGVSPEGLIWLSSRRSMSDVWRQNSGVLAMAALLVLIMFGLSRFPNGTNRHGPAVTEHSQTDPNHNAGQVLAQNNANSNPPNQGSPGSVNSIGNQIESEKIRIGAATSKELASNQKPPSSDGSKTETGFRPTELIPAANSSNDDSGLPLSTKVERIEVPSSARPTETTNSAKTSSADTSVAKTDTNSSTPRPGGGGTNIETIREPTAGVEKTTGPDKTAATEDATGIFVLPADGTPPKRFPTLESACAAVADGSAIELRYNGRRSEKPLKLAKKHLTIRAGKGFHPIIEFHLASVAAGAHLRLISLGGGPVKISQVSFEVTVPPFLSAERISLFSFERQDKLSLHGVAVTVSNPGQRPISLFDLAHESNQMLADMKMNNGGIPRDPQELELTECFVRGQGDLIHVRHTKPARITLRDSAISLDGTLLRLEGHSEKPAEQARVELALEHVTGRMGQHLVRFDSGDLPRELIPVKVTANDNILTALGASGLIAMSGSLSDADFRKLLVWSGDKNFYDRSQIFWTFPSGSGSLDFDDWKTVWGATGDSNEKLAFQAERNDWAATTVETLTLERRSESFNPAIGAATDGNNAGADPNKLPKFGDVDPAKVQ